MATHSSILAGGNSRIEEPGRLQFTGLQRVKHVLAAKQQQQCTEKAVSADLGEDI